MIVKQKQQFNQEHRCKKSVKILGHFCQISASFKSAVISLLAMREWSLGVVLENYEDLIAKRKTVETRAPDPSNPEKDFSNVSINDILAFHAFDGQFHRIAELPIIRYSVLRVNRYSTVDNMLEREDFSSIMPRENSREEAIKVYHFFPGYRERMEKYGMIACGLGKRHV